jgi:hypothetical protein
LIIKGRAVGCVRHWSRYLDEAAQNEKVAQLEIRGTLARDVPGALTEMQDLARATRCQGNFLYHASFNPHPQDRALTPEEILHGIDTLEKALGFEGHQRIVYEHVKQGRQHLHILWNRTDPEKLTIRGIGGDWFICRATSNRLENEFGLIRTKPVRQPSDPRPLHQWELERSKKGGLDPNAIKAELGGLWQASATGQEFKQAMEGRGYILARGDRRDFVVIDKAGHDHSLARRLDGVSTAQLPQRMMDIDRASLPSVAEARSAAKEKREAGRESMEQPRTIANPQRQAARGQAEAGPAGKPIAAIARVLTNSSQTNTSAPGTDSAQIPHASKFTPSGKRGGNGSQALASARPLFSSKAAPIATLQHMQPYPTRHGEEQERKQTHNPGREPAVQTAMVAACPAPDGIPKSEAAPAPSGFGCDDQDAIALDLALDQLFRLARLRLSDASQQENGDALAETRAAIVRERARAARHLVEQYRQQRAVLRRRLAFPPLAASVNQQNARAAWRTAGPQVPASPRGCRSRHAYWQTCP